MSEFVCSMILEDTILQCERPTSKTTSIFGVPLLAFGILLSLNSPK
jgi:hypothetical protein